MSTETEIQSTATAEQLNHAIDEIWSELKSSGELEERARSANIDAAAILDAPRGDVIVLTPRGPGLDPGTTAVLLTFATMIGTKVVSGLAKMSSDVWTEMILPRLRRKFGPDSVRPRN